MTFSINKQLLPTTQLEVSPYQKLLELIENSGTYIKI